LKTIGLWFKELQDAVESLEHAAFDPQCREEVEHTLPEIDAAYSAVLRTTSSVLVPEATFSKEEKKHVTVIELASHVFSHQRLDRFYEQAWQALDCVGPWSRTLVSFDLKSEFDGRGQIAHSWYTVRDADGLNREAARFEEWRTRRATQDERPRAAV
jgi:hypothetical protein